MGPEPPCAATPRCAARGWRFIWSWPSPATFAFSPTLGRPGALRRHQRSGRDPAARFAIPARLGGLAAAAGESWLAFGTVGVPHLVVRVDDIERGGSAEARTGTSLRSATGPEGANVNFVAPGVGGGEPWRIRTYERGVEGETLACGTGTVAAAIALAARGEARLPLRFRSRGGPELLVRAELNGSVAHERLARRSGPSVVPGGMGGGLIEISTSPGRALLKSASHRLPTLSGQPASHFPTVIPRLT